MEIAMEIAGELINLVIYGDLMVIKGDLMGFMGI